MDFELTVDQEVLVDASRRFITETWPLTRVRDGALDDAEAIAAYRRQAGELGWFSLAVDPAHGGGGVSDAPLVDAFFVAHARGRSLQPGAFVGTNVVARALSVAGTAQQRAEVLPALMAGEVSGTWLIAAGAGDPVLDGPILAEVAGATHTLTGAATLVEHDGGPGWLLITAAAPAGPSQYLVAGDAPGVAVERRGSLDLSRRLADVRLDGVEVSESALVGAPGDAAPLVAEQLALAATLAAGESVGAMDAELDLTVQYAKDRIAFGRPIGSFQGLKHQLADTSLALELAKSIALAAAGHLGGDEGYGPEAASMAKALVGDTGIALAQTCFQVFGGIGFTWEHDQHLYLRRLTTDAALYGNPVWHRERVCALAGV